MSLFTVIYRKRTILETDDLQQARDFAHDYGDGCYIQYDQVAINTINAAQQRCDSKGLEVAIFNPDMFKKELIGVAVIGRRVEENIYNVKMGSDYLVSYVYWPYPDTATHNGERPKAVDYRTVPSRKYVQV